MAEPKLAEKQWDIALEEQVIRAWEREPDLYAFDPTTGKPVFIIDTPPPYPSGTWHPGAVIGYSMIDALARARRMLGHAVLFPFGLDRNGINIERTVEGKYGKPLHAWDRQEFLDKCREEIGAIGEGIQGIARRMGMSMDLAATYYTDRDDYRAFSQAIFIDLWNRGLVYRGERPSIYCPACGTPLAEADIEYEERDATLSWIRFPLEGGGSIAIATTRPELLPAARAVIVHPDDERWTSAQGRQAVIPIFGHRVPVLPHPSAKMEFGSGAAMICSYGDTEDIRLFREMRLEPVKAIDEGARMTAAAGPYEGLTVEEARKKISEDLRKFGSLERSEPIRHATPTCYRSQTPVEFLSSRGWYLKQLEFRNDLRKLAETMEFHPARARQLLLDWMNGLTIDWPISRTRYYHTEIPLWYCGSCGEAIAPPPGRYYRPWRDPAPFSKCPKCGGSTFRGEEAVFDTWMDSSNSNLWVARYRTDAAFFEEHFPVSLRPQGRDIVRTWLYYTTLKSWLVEHTAPFEHVFVHGMGLDERGQAMSKSLGNYQPPEPLIEKFGADVIRFFGASEAGAGEDFRISEDRIQGAGKFISKLWNTARFISAFAMPPAGKLRAADEWILAELNRLIVDCRAAYEDSNLAIPANRCREFVWNLFAPHYLEMVKGRAYEGDDGARFTLHAVLRDVLRLLAPIAPFVTDACWRGIYGGSVHREAVPQIRAEIREDLTSVTAAIEAFNSEVWKRKREGGIPLSATISDVTIPEPLRRFAPDLKRMHHLG